MRERRLGDRVHPTHRPLLTHHSHPDLDKYLRGHSSFLSHCSSISLFSIALFSLTLSDMSLSSRKLYVLLSGGDDNKQVHLITYQKQVAIQECITLLSVEMSIEIECQIMEEDKPWSDVNLAFGREEQDVVTQAIAFYTAAKKER